jgi:RNA polymerase sigma-70 factor (ECF subfamily)
MRGTFRPAAIWKHEEDYALYREYLADNVDAGAILYERAYPSLCRFIRRQSSGSILNGQDTEEVISKTIYAAFFKSTSYKGEGSFSAWAYGIAKNKLRDAYREKQKYMKRHCVWSDYYELGADPLDILIKKQLYEAVGVSLNALPSQMRAILTLSVIEERKIKEIIVILGITRKSYLEQYNRAIELFRHYFNKNYHSLL